MCVCVCVCVCVCMYTFVSLVCLSVFLSFCVCMMYEFVHTRTYTHTHTHTQTCSAVLCMRLRVCLAFASKSSFSTIPLYDTPCESRNPLRSFTYYTCLVYQCTRLVCVCARAHVCLLIVVCSKHASPSAVQCEPPQDPCMQHQCMYKCVCAHTLTCMHVSVYISM